MTAILLFSILAVIVFQSGVVKADKLTIKDTSTLFTTKNQPAPIYADPETTQATGKTLSTAVDTWKVFQTAYDGNYIVAYNLGGNQWVKITDGRPNSLSANPNRIFREFYSNGEATTVYSDPYLTQPSGKLDPSISHWAITRVSNPTQADGTYSFDLGDNQWVGLSDKTRVIEDNYYFQPGTPLYNENGQQTQTIDNPKHYNYQIFDVTTINGGIYVKLGSDDQWALYDAGSPY